MSVKVKKQPTYLLKYHVTPSLFHKAAAVYAPIHVKAATMDGRRWLGVVLCVQDKPSLIRFTSVPWTISPLSNL